MVAAVGLHGGSGVCRCCTNMTWAGLEFFFMGNLLVLPLYPQQRYRLAEYQGLHGLDGKYSELNFGSGAGEAVK